VAAVTARSMKLHLYKRNIKQPTGHGKCTSVCYIQSNVMKCKKEQIRVTYIIINVKIIVTLSQKKCCRGTVQIVRMSIVRSLQGELT